MSRAEAQVAETIVGALQERIAVWQQEIEAIDVLRARQDRKQQRYVELQEFVASAHLAIDEALKKLEPRAAEPEATAEATDSKVIP